jgi:outer membrane protein assembly factor BamB
MGTKTNQADQKSTYLIGFVIILAITCCASYQFSPLFLPDCYESSSEPRIPISNENFEENWYLSDLFLSTTDSAVFMAANEEHVVLYGVNGRCGNPKLINLNADDGTVFREGVKAMPSNSGIYHAAYSSDYFFLGYNGPGKAIEGTTIGAGGIAAYEINVGKFYWTKVIPGTRAIYSLVANDDAVAIDGGGFSDYYYLVDSDSGEIISSSRKFTSGFPGSRPAINMAYLYDFSISTPSIQYKPDVQNIEFWAERFDNVLQPPVLSDDVLFIRRGVGTSLGSVAALNGLTGDLIWETGENIVSNVAVDGAAAFFMTHQSELVALDVETGQKVGSVQFSNGETQLGEDRGYFVAASGGNVFVYLGDSHQLFAFHFLADN